MQASRISGPFHVITKPVGPKCNLNCEYCFYLSKEELFPDSCTVHDFTMRDKTLEEFVKQYISERHLNVTQVDFAWQGGEPTLLGIDFFRKVVHFQRKYSFPGIKVTNAIQTNGVLLDDEWGRFLHDNNFLVGISIDGPEQFHNKFRNDFAGKGSFDRVMRGLEALQRYNVEYNTLTAVQSHNSDHPEKVYQFLKNIGSIFMQFIPIVMPLADGEVSPQTVSSNQWGKFLCSILDQWLDGDIGHVYVQHFEVMLSLLMEYPAPICVHSKTCGRSVALEHNGNLYSCDHFVTPRNYLGNIHEISLSEMIEGKKQARFGRAKYTDLPAFCRECRFLNYCYGGCPLHRVRKTPDREDGLNYLCEGYYKFYSYSEKYFRAMAAALYDGRPACEYRGYNKPAVTSTTKIGRNSPCPCGSGKKFKKCCGKN